MCSGTASLLSGFLITSDVFHHIVEHNYFFSPFLGLDVKSEACQRFFRDGLTISFTKILTDEAVSGWKFEIHVSFPFDF